MQHLLCKIRGPFDDDGLLLGTLRDACLAAGANIIGVNTHQFQPQGFTAILLLAESHASIHTWPEENFALLDYFSCAKDPRIDVFLGGFIEAGFTILEQQIIIR